VLACAVWRGSGCSTGVGRRAARDGFVTRAATRNGTGLAAACIGAVEVDATGTGRGGTAFAFPFPFTATP
jgi:hypothetical protein